MISVKGFIPIIELYFPRKAGPKIMGLKAPILWVAHGSKGQGYSHFLPCFPEATMGLEQIEVPQMQGTHHILKVVSNH